MFIDKEEKIKIIATGSKRISFIKKILCIKDVKLNDVFYIEWYKLKGTNLRRSKIKVKCDDCKTIFEKRICDLDLNENTHLCRSCGKKGQLNGVFGKSQNENTKNAVKKTMLTNNPTKRLDVREKISNARKGKPSNMLGKHHSEIGRIHLSNAMKIAWKEGKFTPHYDEWMNIKSEIYKGIEYQCSYELEFLKYIEKIGYLNDIERGPKIRYINKDNEHKIYFCDYRLKNSNIIFEIKSSYFLELHKENYLLKENAAKKKYDYNLVLDNDFSIVDKKIKQYNEVYKFSKMAE